MRPADWHLTEDLDDFLAGGGDFLRSRPALHTTQLTAMERLRTHGSAQHGDGATLFGRRERAGEVEAVFHRLPSRGLAPTSLTPDQADTLAARLADLGQALPYVTADQNTATAFAEAWQRRTGATSKLRVRLHLYRLGTLTPPEPLPEGQARIAGEEDHEQVTHWCHEFATAVDEVLPDSWADTRFADKHFTFWETPDGTPVSIAGATSKIGGMIRVDPVYTPGHLRGHGYAAAVTAEVSRAALATGASDVVLFTNPANPTSNALYRRLGYVLLTDWAVYDFSGATPE
ncbi:GNAT family N-acetyltransferase [Streptomyces sp. MBT65]|uniref:GNAT family N-acetyltransferase n=1 Tax=Streptomyces sp. MBT65 TaxID=1488395 RepID=UPI00190C4A95|nr:GNAT family N-acetyltransferase [Streptomyces sp. MBT65]MBK3580774.1 GNAT family N-acetyltransferase [Streptomyces sp. MBT65]